MLAKMISMCNSHIAQLGPKARLQLMSGIHQGCYPPRGNTSCLIPLHGFSGDSCQYRESEHGTKSEDMGATSRIDAAFQLRRWVRYACQGLTCETAQLLAWVKATAQACWRWPQVLQQGQPEIQRLSCI